MKQRTLLIVFGFLAVVALLHLLSLDATLLLGLRIAAVAALGVYTAMRRTLTGWIFYAMVLGLLIGYDFPAVGSEMKFLSDIFLHLIKTIIAPLLFSTLVVGIAGHSDLKQVGRMGWKSLVYFEVVTTLALVIGLIAINISKAGVGIDMSAMPSTGETLQAVKGKSWQEIIVHIFPTNIAKSIADGEVLQIVVFSVLFGVGLAMVKEDKRKPMLEFTESLAEVMFKFTNMVMYLAPVAAGASIAYAVSHMGLGILSNLFQLLATLYVALIAFLLLVLLPVIFLFRIPLKAFLRALSEPVTIAFATASSEAALPRAMEGMERLGVPRKVVAFVLPTGYSFNLDGSTLYLSLAAIFVAQAAGVELPIGQQILIVLTLMLTSKGVAGIARASLVILLGTLASFNLPTEPVLFILGIDVLMDMARTAVNVTGNCLASAVIARWEGEFDDAKAAALAAEVPGSVPLKDKMLHKD